MNGKPSRPALFRERHVALGVRGAFCVDPNASEQGWAGALACLYGNHQRQQEQLSMQQQELQIPAPKMVIRRHIDNDMKEAIRDQLLAWYDAGEPLADRMTLAALFSEQFGAVVTHNHIDAIAKRAGKKRGLEKLPLARAPYGTGARGAAASTPSTPSTPPESPAVEAPPENNPAPPMPTNDEQSPVAMNDKLVDALRRLAEAEDKLENARELAREWKRKHIRRTEGLVRNFAEGCRLQHRNALSYIDVHEANLLDALNKDLE